MEHLSTEQKWSWDEDTTYRDEAVGIHTRFHSALTEAQPGETNDGSTLLWLLGDVYGHRDAADYSSRPPTIDSVEYCVSLFERYGLEFVNRLNGNFVGIVYDREERRVSIFTDRLGSQAVFYAQPDDQFVFSTELQALPSHPDVAAAFDREYLSEYLVFRRVFGVKTPLRDVEKLPPASVTTIDLADGSVESRRYWEPRYRPRNEPFEWFVDRFVATFKRVINEWTEPDRRYGLLLSGGSDARLVLAAMDEPVTAFHLTDWRNAETRISERIATAAGAAFRPLHRGDDYFADLMRRNAPLSNFDGYFFQGYATPFAEDIRGEVDALLSGLYADTLFKDHPLPRQLLPLGPIGKTALPFGVRISSVDEVIDHWLGEAGESVSNSLPYLDAAVDIRDILRRNTRWVDGAIDFHGVRYHSLDELLLSCQYYPLSNDTELIHTNSLRQILPYRSPFLDNRLIDLHLTLPIEYRLRRNLIHRAVERLDDDLAAIPHASTGVPLSRTYLLQYLGEKVTALRRKYLQRDSSPKSYLTHDGWRDRAEFIRTDEWVADFLAENEWILRELPLLDAHGAHELYERHLTGADNTAELYTLITLLGMPLSEEMVSDTTEKSITRSVKDVTEQG